VKWTPSWAVDWISYFVMGVVPGVDQVRVKVFWVMLEILGWRTVEAREVYRTGSVLNSEKYAPI